MIILPASPGTRAVVPRLLDFGVIQRPSTGAPATRIDRPGMRWAADIEWPPMLPSTANLFHSRLARGLSQGLRVTFPLLRASQAAAGSPVAGAGAAGTSVPVTGGAAGASLGEGWWINVSDAAGARYLHQLAAPVTLSGAGAGTLSVWPPLRCAVPAGSAVEFAAPVIEGLITELPPAARPVTGLVRLAVSIEEAA